jgi:chaperone required for assembly of F1-ATPase
MRKTLDDAVKEIGQYRGEIEKKLLEFARTDVLFFWGEKRDLYLKQETEWQPIINWIEELLKVKVKKTSSLDTPDNEEMQEPLKITFAKMSDIELACYYAAALNMKSVLLALALIKGKIDAKTAGRLSYLEELWQNEMWGSDEEALKRREERCSELVEIESYLKK